MINVKKIVVAKALAFSILSFGQVVSSTAHYPQMYENQASSNNVLVGRTIMSAKEQIDSNINRMMTDPVLKNANWGFVIYDPKTGKIVSSYNETSPLVPASTTKLLTTETAMSLLGTKFRWVTQLDYSGQIDAEGTLNGNLYLVGSGDPTMGTGKAGAYSYSEIASQFVQAVVQKGIRKITGDIVMQTAVFKENKTEALPENIVWLENNNYYLPAGSTKDIDPHYEKMVAKQNNPFSESKNYFYVSPYIHKIVFTDKFDGAGYVATKIPDAPAYLANYLRTALGKSGIPVIGKVVAKMVDNNPEKRETISQYKSPTLSEIIYYTNQHSDNGLAEATVRMVGFQKLGDQSLQSGRSVVMENLRNRGFDLNGLNYMDGSGLSKSNTVTPIAQAKFLASLMNEKFYKDYFDSLPIAGQTGTLKKMFFGNSYGQIFAKTGTLNKVKCLAGYIKTRSGKTLTFSLLVNNYAGSVDGVKSRMEQLLDPAMEL